MQPKMIYSYPRGENVPAQLAFDALLERRHSREDFAQNVASIFPACIGPTDPAWVEWATTTLFTGQATDRIQTHVEYAIARAGEDALNNPQLALAATQQAQRSRALVTHLTGEAPYLNLVAMQRGLHAERDLSTAGELHRDVMLEHAREIGIISHYRGSVNVDACARHGLDPRRWSLRVLDHSKLPIDFHDHMVDVLMEMEQPLDAADLKYLDTEVGWHTLEVNQDHFLPDWMFHKGGGYLSVAERARFGHDDIGYYAAWNAEMHLRRSYVCPLTSEMKGADRSWTGLGPAVAGALGLGSGNS